MLGEGPIPGVTWLPRYSGPGEGWRVDVPLRNLHGLGEFGEQLGQDGEAVAEAKVSDMAKAGGAAAVVGVAVFLGWLLTRKKR